MLSYKNTFCLFSEIMQIKCQFFTELNFKLFLKGGVQKQNDQTDMSFSRYRTINKFNRCSKFEYDISILMRVNVKLDIHMKRLVWKVRGLKNTHSEI